MCVHKQVESHGADNIKTSWVRKGKEDIIPLVTFSPSHPPPSTFYGNSPTSVQKKKDTATIMLLEDYQSYRDKTSLDFCIELVVFIIYMLTL